MCAPMVACTGRSMHVWSGQSYTDADGENERLNASITTSKPGCLKILKVLKIHFFFVIKMA